MTHYAVHDDRHELIACWAAGYGETATTVAALPAAANQFQRLVLAEALTRLSRALWHCYTHPASATPSTAANSEGWQRQETRASNRHPCRSIAFRHGRIARSHIYDPSGSAGEVGEVWIKGKILMKGYWNSPDATAEAIRDGWLHTGDLGTLDADGDLRIVGRLKELIIRGGYNVYPSEVEEVLYQHPDVVEAAVVGVTDERYGEEVAAAIVLRDGATLDADDLRAWAKQRLSAYKVPHRIRMVSALPKGPSGKILKRAIDREQFRREDQRADSSTDS